MKNVAIVIARIAVDEKGNKAEGRDNIHTATHVSGRKPGNEF
jgi:hypothetical protein